MTTHEALLPATVLQRRAVVYVIIETLLGGCLIGVLLFDFSHCIDHSKSTQIYEAAHRDRLRGNMNRTCRPYQDWAYCDRIRGDFEKAECNIRGIKRGHDQQVGSTFISRLRLHFLTDEWRERSIGVHLAFDVEFGLHLENAFEDISHFLR